MTLKTRSACPESVSSSSAAGADVPVRRSDRRTYHTYKLPDAVPVTILSALWVENAIPNGLLSCTSSQTGAPVCALSNVTFRSSPLQASTGAVLWNAHRLHPEVCTCCFHKSSQCGSRQT